MHLSLLLDWHASVDSISYYVLRFCAPVPLAEGQTSRIFVFICCARVQSISRSHDTWGGRGDRFTIYHSYIVYSKILLITYNCMGREGERERERERERESHSSSCCN